MGTKRTMRVTGCEPVVARFSVHIENVAYKHGDGTISLISMDVDCTLAGEVIAAGTRMNKPFIYLGGAYWKEAFGDAANNRIRQLCKRAVLAAIAKAEKGA